VQAPLDYRPPRRSMRSNTSRGGEPLQLSSP